MEKADVHAYGIVLPELLSSFKGTELSKTAGKQFVSDWGLALLKRGMIDQLIGPRPSTDYDKREAELMMRMAELCPSSLPEERPRILQVLKLPQGDTPITTNSRELRSSLGRRHSSAVTCKLGRNDATAKSRPTVKSDGDEAEGNHDVYNS